MEDDRLGVLENISLDLLIILNYPTQKYSNAKFYLEYFDIVYCI